MDPVILRMPMTSRRRPTAVIVWATVKAADTLWWRNTLHRCLQRLVAAALLAAAEVLVEQWKRISPGPPRQAFGCRRTPLPRSVECLGATINLPNTTSTASPSRFTCPFSAATNVLKKTVVNRLCCSTLVSDTSYSSRVQVMGFQNEIEGVLPQEQIRSRRKDSL